MPEPVDRAALRARRRALDPAAAAAAALDATRLGLVAGLLDGVGTIAGYLAGDGELDPAPLLSAAVERGARLVLPRLLEGGRLEFASADATLIPNRFGIAEPAPGVAAVALDAIDLVIVPLVAFDRRGNRAGRGAGYYDRTFAGRRDAPPPPLLVGWGHAWQEVDHLVPAPWDVGLDLIVTPLGVVEPVRHA